MKHHGLDHLAIAVPDTEAALKTWRDTLGFPVLYSEVVNGGTVRPCYLIAKGGITSSDLATRGLGVKRAMAAGQLLPGIPAWRLSAEAECPGLNYVVFPGNVDGPQALSEAVSKLSITSSR